ncbi:MAG: hypothetical protein AABX33_04335 [Nanoarchaeota archaeon]
MELPPINIEEIVNRLNPPAMERPAGQDHHLISDLVIRPNVPSDGQLTIPIDDLKDRTISQLVRDLDRGHFKVRIPSADNKYLKEYKISKETGLIIAVFVYDSVANEYGIKEKIMNNIWYFSTEDNAFLMVYFGNTVNWKDPRNVSGITRIEYERYLKKYREELREYLKGIKEIEERTRKLLEKIT